MRIGIAHVLLGYTTDDSAATSERSINAERNIGSDISRVPDTLSRQFVWPARRTTGALAAFRIDSTKPSS